MKDVQFNVYNVEKMLVQPPERLAFVRFDPNNDCNVHCVYCHNHRSKMRVATEDLQTFLERCVLGTDNFQVGCIMEPTLDKRLADLILLIGRSQARPQRQFILQTNGILLHMHDHAKMVKAGLNRLSVSVDSADGTKHKALRGGTSLKKVAHNVGSFHRACPTVRINFMTTVTSANVDELEELIGMGLDLGVESFVFREVFHFPENDVVDHDQVRELLLRPGDFARLRDRLCARFGGKAELHFADNAQLDDHNRRTKADSFR